MQAEPTSAGERSSKPSGWRAAVCGLSRLVRFHSRLPVPAPAFDPEPHAPPDFRAHAPLLPLAGFVIGLPAAITLFVLVGLGAPHLMAAALSAGAAALTTGAMHEDGLADSFDGLGSHGPPEKRMAIMRDSRIGAFGATALALALIMKVAGLAALVSVLGALGGGLAMLAAACLSRSVMLTPLVGLPPARIDGAAASVGTPDAAAFAASLTVGCALCGGLTVAGGAPVHAFLAGLAIALAFAAAMTYWAGRAIGGHTGDVAGACQQLAEIGFYLGVLMIVDKASG